MAATSPNEAARWIPLLVLGTTLNTLGIVLQGLGRLRFLLMGIGLALLLLAVVKLVAAVRTGPDGPRG